MSLRVGVVGCGAFSPGFIILFKAHPLVESVVLCDLDADKLAAAAERHGIADTRSSLEDLCADASVDAVALFTQNWLHGPQAAAALRAGKHVYSAVPTGITAEEVTDLVEAASGTDRLYMLGETSYYYPGVIYCRGRFRAGDFGRPVYAEAEYLHDFSHGLYAVMESRGGRDWKRFAGGPPMQYPTHSTSQILSVTGARMTHVSGHGFVDDHEDGLFRAGSNQWDNEFSNETAFYRLSDGSACRIAEMRRVGHPGGVRMSLYGTAGSYEQHVSGVRWLTARRAETEPLEELLTGTGVPGPRDGDGLFEAVAPVHPVHRLPRQFLGLPNGHRGSHQFLVDDFVRAAVDGVLPPNNAWAAARYMLPGLVAHDSARRGGELLEIPDLGDPPSTPVEYDEPAAGGA